jgi:hypothetical protein
LIGPPRPPAAQPLVENSRDREEIWPRSGRDCGLRVRFRQRHIRSSPKQMCMPMDDGISMEPTCTQDRPGIFRTAQNRRHHGRAFDALSPFLVALLAAFAGSGPLRTATRARIIPALLPWLPCAAHLRDPRAAVGCIYDAAPATLSLRTTVRSRSELSTVGASPECAQVRRYAQVCI